MTIPALFATSSGDRLMARNAFFNGCKIDEGFETDYKQAGSEFKDSVRKPVVVVDSDSINHNCFEENVMKKMALKGNDIWFMTHIEYVEDVFDSFNTVAEYVLAPLHSVSNKNELKEIISVSDSVIPSIFVIKGNALGIEGKRGDLFSVLDSVIDCGYCRTCIVDTDSSLPGEIWEELYDEHPATLPFVSNDNEKVFFGDFRNIIKPAEL